MKYQLWMAAPSDGHMFIREDNRAAQELARAEGMQIVWSVDASGHDEANQLLYDHLGYGEYRPFLDEHGHPYPEDEDDQFIATSNEGL